ncbi:hypothetical protein BS35_003248 [Actinomadura glauciflava]|nr:hypothetical protein [Actinomadura glauciflava]
MRGREVSTTTICPATGIGAAFHVPDIIETTAKAIAEAPGVNA